MKISFNADKNIKTPSFQGYEIKKTAAGRNAYEFNFPHDTDKFDCYVELGMVYENDDHVPYVEDIYKNTETGEGRTKINPKGEILNLQEYGIKKNDYFAYRFILKDKRTGVEYEQVDSGIKIGPINEQYNLVSQNGSKMTKGGGAMLVIPDTYNPGWVYDENKKPAINENIRKNAVESTKAFSIKSGGTLAGMENDILKWEKMGISRIFSTPMFTDDDTSYHGYWIKNAMQMSQNIGTIENYASFQKKMFKSGINLVADGAFVNEGLEGVHFKHVLKWGEKSPYYYWFRINGIEGGALNLGVLSNAKENISHKIVNSPYKYTQEENGKIKIKKTKNYDPKKPTYVQIFDRRLVSDALKQDTQNLIKAYDKIDSKNITDINTHDDTIIPYKFEVEPETYKNNIKKLNELNSKSETKIKMNSLAGTRVLTKFENFSLEEKFESGFETWDANTDIPKINYSISQADLETLKNKDAKTAKEKTDLLTEKNFEAQDYAISAGKYWTKRTKDILLEETARNLESIEADPNKVMTKINELVDKKELPKSAKEKVSIESIKAALNGKYDLPRNKRVPDMHDLLLSGLMDLPLDAIELGDDIVATMGTPSMTNRAYCSDEIGVSKYLLHRNHQPHLLSKYEKTYIQMDNIYTEKMIPKAEKIMRKVNIAIGHKLFDDYNATVLGKYTLPIVGQDIAKFLIVKALSPGSINIEKETDGTLNYSYDYKKMKETTFHSFGTMPRTPEEEIDTLIQKLENGLNNISDKDVQALVDTITKRIKNTSGEGYKVAEMILDATSAGLDWRIDAAKDVTDMDGVRNGTSEFGNSWNEVIDFWGKFTNTVLKENKNSYLVAEITDVRGEKTKGALFSETGRFHNAIEAEQKLLQETGMNSLANYSYLFTTLAEIFGKNNEDGNSIDNKNSKLHDVLNGYESNGHVLGFLESDQLQSIIYSYTFAGNHDKPRLLHCLTVDMSVFYANFKTNGNARKAAEYVLNKSEHDIDFNKLSPKAVAVGDTLKAGIEKVVCNEFKLPISKAIEELVQADGTKADGLASKPFEKSIEFIIKTAKEKHGLTISPDDEKKLINKAFKTIIVPAMSRFEGLNQFLVSLPGLSTLFAGDDLAMTGYEGKCKNDYHQNRNALDWNVLNDENKEYIKEFNARVNETMNLRGRKELEPLNTGTPYLLEQQIPKNSPQTPITALLRQGSNGAMTVSLLNAAGVSYEKDKGIDNTDLHLDGIKLNGMGLGLAAGVTEGTIFKNADESDKSVYKVVKEARNGGAYFDYLIKKEGGDIKLEKPTLILYHQPQKKETSFTGKKVLYNPQYNFISNPYSPTAKKEIGSKLALISK